MARIKVEGIDYSPDGIEGVRQEMTHIRGEALKQNAFPEAVLFSHVIALLADYKEIVNGDDAGTGEVGG